MTRMEIMLLDFGLGSSITKLIDFALNTTQFINFY